MSEDVFHSVSMIMNVNSEEIAKIVHDYINRGIVSDYDRLNCPKPPIYIGQVKVKSLKERLEEMKMKATSTETFHDIIAIDFELQTFPNPDTQDKFIVSATNRDDIFAFVFEGPNLRDACRNAGLFTGWEKDQKIKELKEENKDLKKRYDRLNKKFNKVMNDNLPKTPITDAMIVDDYNKLVEENKLLKKELAFEKAANEAQHRFIKEYAGKGTEVQFNYVVNPSDNEVSYVIVDKKTYDEKPNINLHGKDFTPDELVDRVLELEEENDRFKKQLHAVQLMLDNFRKDHEDILKTQREKHEDEVEQLNKLLTLYEKRLDELIKEKKNLIEENENLKKAYDILDKTLDKSQKACNKWYEKWVKMQSEQDGHTKLQEEKIADNVNHPSHYTGKYECIDVMQDVFGDEATDNFCLCNAFKYIWRARKKNGLEDVKKAVWYLNKYIEEAEKDGVPKGK